ncbi:MAG TPA: TIGR01777 family oxidoreductase [Gemmatimonadaceae bacterium]|nr:TIGR01777 family oxidoreductase [Gemmatimonadaceae bacterium]
MAQSPNPQPDDANRRIAISGASGFLGTALASRLKRESTTIQRLRRGERAASPDIAWQPDADRLDIAALDGIDALINLSGEPIARRWTSKRKQAIRDSRVNSTMLLSRSIAALRHPPRVFVSGSAIGIYGDRGDEEIDEESSLGADFLARTAEAWERSTEPARAAGIRVVCIRTGIVLNPRGGALAKMMLPFKFGVGGAIGSGAQWMSWIGLEDWLSAVEFALAADVSGAMNMVAPNPVTNAEFAKTLARVLARPAFIPVPALAISLIFGEMGHATLLASQRIHPRRLVEAGFEFAHPTLEQALRAELGQSSALAPNV